MPRIYLHNHSGLETPPLTPVFMLQVISIRWQFFLYIQPTVRTHEPTYHSFRFLTRNAIVLEYCPQKSSVLINLASTRFPLNTIKVWAEPTNDKNTVHEALACREWKICIFGIEPCLEHCIRTSGMHWMRTKRVFGVLERYSWDSIVFRQHINYFTFGFLEPTSSPALPSIAWQLIPSIKIKIRNKVKPMVAARTFKYLDTPYHFTITSQQR